MFTVIFEYHILLYDYRLDISLYLLHAKYTVRIT